MQNADKFRKQSVEISEQSAHMREALIDPIRDDATGGFIGEAAVRNERINAATEGTLFAKCGPAGPTIQGYASNAIRAYCEQHGHRPSDDVLAAGYRAIDSAIELTSGRAKVGGIFESAASLATQDTAQTMMRDRMIALILPAMLQSVTANMVGYVPGDNNQSEIFRVWRIADKTFGGMTAGDRIDHNFRGQYGSMDQRFFTVLGNGVKTGSAAEFDFNSATVLGAVHPVKKKSVRIIVDRNVVAMDNGQGSFVKVGDTGITLDGGSTINYATGVIHPVFSAAIAVGLEVHIGVDIDIEKDPTLIPTVSHEMDSRVLHPHESAIAASTTLQALWGMRREFNLNMDGLAMTAMRNLLAADKDRKHLSDMYFYRKGEKSWTYTLPATGISMQDYYETLRTSLLELDAALLLANGVAGLSGIVADTKSCTIFRSLKSPHFTPAPRYRHIPQPHYVGRLFGMWDLYEDPQGTDYDCMGYAKGSNIAEAAYVAGDAIPAMAFKHPIGNALKYDSTLWELAYRDVQPFDGRDFAMKLTLTA